MLERAEKRFQPSSKLQNNVDTGSLKWWTDKNWSNGGSERQLAWLILQE